MAALSAVTFALSWWLGLYLVARDPRKPVLALAALGLCGYAVVMALDTVRLAAPAHAEMLGRIEIYLVAVPGWRGSPGAARAGPARRVAPAGSRRGTGRDRRADRCGAVRRVTGPLRPGTG